MQEKKQRICITNAHANNLKGISLEIPHHQLIVVTGVSGSGKSSLVFDIIAQEGQRRYFETLPSFSRQFLGKMNPAKVEQISGLSPVISIGQKTTGGTARSTVGTMSDLYAWLRLLYARTGKQPQNKEEKLSRSHFSFNSDLGKCQRCNGIGKEEQIDLNKLIANPEKTIREGALAPSLPNGYIMYSQVTLDVLNTVCEAEGFSIDIPWNKLTALQKEVILYGSEKIKVPFGKHSLESRLKWTGIKAKPREEGFYKGMIPIMSDILKRDRNPSILKYASAVTCPKCEGTRLNTLARNVTVKNHSLPELLTWDIHQLYQWFLSLSWDKIAEPIIQSMLPELQQLITFGLGQLTLNTPARELSASEAQRIRIANQLSGKLSNVLYVFDEPSIGLHSDENKAMIQAFRQLVEKGNTVIVVEHDVETIRSADWIVDIGPEAGINGGTLLFNGKKEVFLKTKTLAKTSPTYDALTRVQPRSTPSQPIPKTDILRFENCAITRETERTLSFQKAALNTISGPSGSGTSTFMTALLIPSLENQLSTKNNPLPCQKIIGLEDFSDYVFIDQSPIGRTPRSNPSTYLGISDQLRDLYSKLPQAKELQLKKSHFSFNTKGGRCETCMGAGKIQVGMHFLGQVDLICETCGGNRFNHIVTTVHYRNKSITDVYALSVKEAVSFFDDQPKIKKTLVLLKKIGLGYLTLGQASTTLSGGEAQRIKLVNQLQKKTNRTTLYALRDPSTGLHPKDIERLLLIFDEITTEGHTIICTEQDEQIIAHAAQRITFANRNLSLPKTEEPTDLTAPTDWITLSGVDTHLLRSVSVRIPKNQITAVTGISGSGKSSLIYDTLYAEANSQFSASLSTYARSFLKQENQAKIEKSSGLTPCIAIRRINTIQSKRSTVATLSGIHPVLRLLYSRIAQHNGKNYSAHDFSHHHLPSTCATCRGNGWIEKCDPTKVISNPQASPLEDAFAKNKALNYYTDPNGQFMATLMHIATENNWNLNQPWHLLTPEVKQTILHGTGEKVWEHAWHYKTKTREGTQELSVKWKGICSLITEEYELRKHNKNTDALRALLHDEVCTSCNGERLNSTLLAVKFRGESIGKLTQHTVSSIIRLIETVNDEDPIRMGIIERIRPSLLRTLHTLEKLGLGYLSLDRLTKTLSGGEYQRLRLAGLLKNQLYGVTYILDEPTVGLDSENKQVLLDCLREIQASGNTVILIAHDREMIQSADYLLEMGPGSGSEGGNVLYQGAVSDLVNHTKLVTWQLLYGTVKPNAAAISRESESFTIHGAFAQNLKSIDVSFQTNRINAISGISGSGKSTLMNAVLLPSLKTKTPVGCTSLSGAYHFDEVLLVNQAPIQTTKRMTVATFTGVMDILKGIFGKVAKDNGFTYKRGDFSYQSKIGRCSHCHGSGKITTHLDFTSPIHLICPVCEGSRYAKDILDVLVNNKSIAEVLKMTIAEALDEFTQPKFVEALQKLDDIGIGHLPLGQDSQTLSGGEAQRLKLAHELLRNPVGHSLYLVDEPSNGLHAVDLQKIIHLFERLVEKRNTVIFIAHHELLLSISHHRIQLGPGSGEDGGQLI